MSTCQICGREIKLNKYGKISRHGYKQNKLTKLVSSPCLGSHHDPYEVSCYEIKRTIDGLTKAIALNKQKLNELHDKPPSFFHVTSNAIGSIYGAIHVLKPDNFSPTDVTEGEYYKIYRREQSDLMLRIKQFNEQIIYLTYRLNKWIKE